MYLNFIEIIVCLQYGKAISLSVLQEATSDKVWGLVNILKISSK